MRISTTTLESFRLWRDEGRVTYAELVATITRTQTPTLRMRRGAAFGLVLQDPDAYRVPGGYACDGFRFEADTIERALATIDRAGLFEQKRTARYGAHTVVAKADHLLGLDVTEFKTTTAYNPDKYARSYQWRFLLDLFRVDLLTYRVFVVREPSLALGAIEEFSCVPYGALHADCARLVEAFVAFVRSRALAAHLPDRPDVEEWAIPALTAPRRTWGGWWPFRAH